MAETRSDDEVLITECPALIQFQEGVPAMATPELHLEHTRFVF